MNEKKLKKKSLSAQLKKLRERNKDLENTCEKRWDKMSAMRMELNSLKQIIPKKYYRIKYKIMAENKLVYEYSEIIESYSVEIALEKLLNKELYPATFKLEDISLLGE